MVSLSLVYFYLFCVQGFSFSMFFPLAQEIS